MKYLFLKITVCFLLIFAFKANVKSQYSFEVGIPNTVDLYRGVKWKSKYYYSNYYVEANYIPKHIGFGLRFYRGYESDFLGRAFKSYTGYASLIGKINILKSERIQLQIATGYSFTHVPKEEKIINSFHLDFKSMVKLNKHFLLTTAIGYQYGVVSKSIYKNIIGQPEFRMPFALSLGLRYTLGLSKK